MTLRVVMFFLLWLPLFTGEAAACDCAAVGTPCQDYWKASVVFVGVVTGSSRVTLDQGDYEHTQRLVQFSLDRAYKGIDGAEAQVITGLGGGDCGYGFRLGEKYLVYAYRDKENKENKLHTSICTRTRPLSEAKEDLDYIRGISTAPQGSIIFGEVSRLNRNASDGRLKPVEGATIIIEGESKRVEVITDSKGQYRVSALPPGAYKVRLTLPKGLSIYNPEREANVSDRGCAQVRFWVEADTRITGRVFNVQSQPISDVLMELAPAKPPPNGSIYRTRDSGRTWTEITKGLPAGIYVQTVKEDPERRGLLFAGTERAVFVSFDDGDGWQSLQLNLAPASMRDLAIHGNDLVVATHGRGFWVLDDISALRQINGDMAKSQVHLFRPAIAVEVIAGSDNGTPMPRDEPLAENPPFGAVIDYYLKANANGPVTLEIIDPAGEVIRRYSSEDKPPPINPETLNIPAFWVRRQEPFSNAAGMHRWIWDFRPTPPQRAAGAGGGGGGFGRGAATVLPGDYSVRLTVEGKAYTQPLKVKADPRVK